jgi:N-acetylmuramoyl-L-alanine amidase
MKSIKIWATIIAITAVAAGAAGKNNVTGIQLKDYDDYTAVVVSLEKPSKFSVKDLPGSDLAIVVEDCDTGGKNHKTGPKGVVTDVYAKDKDGDAWIVLKLTDRASRYSGKSVKSPAQVILKIIKKPAEKTGGETGEAKPAVKTGKGPGWEGVTLKDKGELDMPGTKAGCAADLDVSFATESNEMTPDKTPNVIDTIFIDPGHGGKYTGAEGPSHIIEKDVNLGISLRLARMLRDDLGCRVALCRVDDRMVLMKDRTRVANEIKADLFIDLHNNGVLNSKVRGTETFFLSDVKADWGRAMEYAENEEFIIENPEILEDQTGLNLILAALAQNEFLQESSELAHYAQENLVHDLGTKDRGVKQAPFYVLVYANMPSILIECEFLTNAEGEKLLTEPDSQEKIARAIYKAIKAYKEDFEEKMGAR